jgi:hypothetical protein
LELLLGEKLNEELEDPLVGVDDLVLRLLLERKHAPHHAHEGLFLRLGFELDLSWRLDAEVQ